MPFNKTNYFLFSVDLEDFRRELTSHNIGDNFLYKTVYSYLDLLDKFGWKATFFTVGKDALKCSELIQEIRHRNHEIGCHSFAHDVSMFESKDSFRDDLHENIDALNGLGVDEIYGYRSPQLSFTKNRIWVYEILKENGFIYSSSVLPASNPLFGWEGFGEKIKKINGIYEIPVSITSIPIFKNIPYAGGIYFRLLPKFLIKKLFYQTFSDGKPVVGYFHPQDIYHSKGVKYKDFNLFFEKLIKMNTVNNLEKINDIFDMHLTVIRYKDYILDNFRK